MHWSRRVWGGECSRWHSTTSPTSINPTFVCQQTPTPHISVALYVLVRNVSVSYSWQCWAVYSGPWKLSLGPSPENNHFRRASACLCVTVRKCVILVDHKRDPPLPNRSWEECCLSAHSPHLYPPNWPHAAANHMVSVRTCLLVSAIILPSDIFNNAGI